ncbi:MAG: hypothetical protein HY680_04280 [Chloroflexi bacterium]|nr:hypothetical protein [Chloroflexota bacterium]
MNLKELLDAFTSQQLGEALSSLGASTAGTKAERIQRFLGVAAKGDEALPELLDHSFSLEAVRDVCTKLGAPTGRKATMIEGITALLNDPGSPSRTTAKTERQPATRRAVIQALRQYRVPRRKARDEKSAQDDLAAYLGSHFLEVFSQYNLGGYFGLRIDFDIGNGRLGIELKLAEALRGAAEAQRFIGQAVYYKQRRYGENLIVAVVGQEDTLSDPGVKETLSFLNELGISCVPIPTI